MIRRFTVTALVGTAAAVGLLAGVAPNGGTVVTPAAMVTSLQPADGPHGDRDHGPGWDGRHGDWDGRGGFGRGGGWDGNGGGWGGPRWGVRGARRQGRH